MGYFEYCKRCRIPRKAFDSGSFTILCGHEEDRDPSVFNSDTDYDYEVELWNRLHPDRPATFEMFYMEEPNPYSVILDDRKDEISNLLSYLASYLARKSM